MDEAGQLRASELRVSKDRRTLTVAFTNGEKFAIPAEILRVLSPSAEVQGHSPDQRVLVSGKSDVAIAEIHATGNYAVRLVFDDRHDTGIYSWTYLHRLGANLDELTDTYRKELAEKGLSR